jgi:cob(I)alamin adenosyltransferase
MSPISGNAVKQVKETERSRGLAIIYTGDGKGKTTPALGMTPRTRGYSMDVYVIQIVEGSFNQLK